MVAVQLIYFLLVYLKAGKKNTTAPGDAELHPISVVLCVKNEEKHLRELIPEIMSQDYPEFQLVVVNDNSWDDSEDILKAFQVSYSNLHVTHLNEDKQRMQGKKFALTLGIKAAKYDHVLLTDADCRPAGKNWIRTMVDGANKKSIALGYSPYRKSKGLLNSFIRFDAYAGALSYLGFARLGMPYMGVGRNLLYDRELFFKVGGFRSHMNLASGDDDLFINQVASSKNTAVVDLPESHVISEPKTKFNAWYKQKRRHLTTAPKYRFMHKFLLALFPFSFYLSWALFIVLLLLHTHPLLVIAPMALRYLFQFFIFSLTSRVLGDRDLRWKAWLLEGGWMIIMPIVSLSVVFRKPNAWN